MKITNISEGKIFNVGDVTVLPGETKEVPAAYETNPTLAIYESMGIAKIIGKPGKQVKDPEQAAAEKAAAEKAAAEKAAAEAEELRKARLATVDKLNEEELGKLANELGINPADCKDQADVLKKVKTALKK